MGKNVLTTVQQDMINGTWYGIISVYDGDNYLYREESEIERLSAADAMKDAESMKADILTQNGGK